MSSKPSGHYLESSRKRGSQQSQRAPQPSYRGTQPAQHSPPYYRRHTYAIDQYLYEKGLKRKYIAKDGSCLFRAVSEQVWLVQAHHWTLRRQTAMYIKTRKDRFKSFLTEPVDKYCFRLSNSSMWGGEMELVALSELLDRHIIVYSEEKGQTKIREFNHSESSDKNSIKLAYTGSNHYDGVWAETDERLYGFCQSLVYDVLYSAVFKNSSLVSKSRQLSLGQTMTPSYGPPDLLKALSMYVFSNIPIEHARMERNDREYRDRQFASSLQYKVGTICDVSVDNDLFRAEIIDNRDYSRIKVKFIDNGRKPMIVSAKQIFFGHSKKSTGGRDQRRGYSGSRVQSEGSTSRREEPKNERPPRETKDFERDRKSRQSKPNNESSGPAPEKRETRGGSGGGKGEGRMTSPKPPNPKISDRRQPVNHSKERGEREGLRQRDKKEVDRGAKGSGDNRRDAVKERASTRGETVTKTNEGISKEKPSNKRPGEGKGGVAREEKGKGSNEKEERVPNSESEKVLQSETKPSQNGNTSRTDDPKETTTSSHPEQYQQRQSPIEQAPPTAIPPLLPPGITKVDEPHPPINIEQRGLIYQMAHGDGNTYYIHSTGIAPEAAAAGGGYLYPVDVFSSTSNNHILVTSGASSLHPQPHPQPYFSEAPECEWPILVQDSRSSASSNSKVVAVDQLHPKSLHIDGPPPQPPPETMFAVPPTHQNVGVVQTSPHVATTQNIFSTDLAPPLHLLHNRTQEDKQVFMFEYAQQCLSCYFNSAIGDQSDLEDLIEELLAMSLEEFLSSPPRYSDGELSTTSPDNSELTDEREVTPLRLVLKTEETVSPSSTSDDQLPPPPREPTPVGEETTEETVVNGKEAETNGDGEIVKEEEEEGEGEEGQEVEEVEDEGMKTYMSLPHPGASPFMMPYQPFIPMMYSMGPQFFGYHHPYRMPAPMMFPPPYFMHPPPHIVPPEPQEEINNDLTDDGDTPLSQPEFKATPPESKPAAVDVSEVPVVAKEKSSSPSPRPSPSPPPPVARQPDKQVQPPRQRNNNNTHETRHRSNQDSRSHSNHDSYHRGNHERTSKGQKSNRSYEARYSRNFTNRSHQNQAKQ
ncbi:PREDICTED: bromodomain-containing protein 4-like [Amphimedon queenslandica]|uniref:OTU domain-containing protein n=1 Tax=Amphimedon queenslandica TaxID=400682 RepID=A0A1X7U471_AMPQE|nr:PREDICTED: bromodomain-containing protein 4-like [Amphimedon queenslandica]|eukprot:XP_019856308.1 PREDICTED: bromodomain-containing protein 4-like [Amphimedon queenslandica]